MLPHQGPALLHDLDRHKQPPPKSQHPTEQAPGDVAAVSAARSVLLAAMQAQACSLLREDQHSHASTLPTGSGSRLGSNGGSRLASRPNPLNQLVSLFNAAHALQHPPSTPAPARRLTTTAACSPLGGDDNSNCNNSNNSNYHNSRNSLQHSLQAGPRPVSAAPHTAGAGNAADAGETACPTDQGLAFPIQALLSTAFGLDVVGPELMQRLIKAYASSALMQGRSVRGAMTSSGAGGSDGICRGEGAARW